MARLDLSPTRPSETGPYGMVWLGITWAALVLYALGVGYGVSCAIEAIATWQTMPAEMVALGDVR